MDSQPRANGVRRRCPRRTVAIAEKFSTADDGVAGQRLERARRAGCWFSVPSGRLFVREPRLSRSRVPGVLLAENLFVVATLS